MIAAILLAALTVPHPPEKPPAAGMLCVDEGPCVATQGLRPHVAASPQARRFVWVAGDRTVISVGAIAANATEVALDAGVSQPLRIRTLATKGLAFELGSPKDAWRWTMNNAPPSIRLIHPACDDCRLTVDAEGFRRFAKPLRETTDVVLHALPRLRGRVTDRATAAPLIGATISIAGALLTKSGTNGVFDAQVAGDWPHSIDVAYPGRAPLRVEVPRAMADTDLPPIALAAGGTLRATLSPPLAEEVTWELRDPKSHAVVRQGRIAASAAQVTIDGIGEGKHSFVIRGAHPLQQLSTTIEIHNESVTEKAIDIDVATVDLEVTRGSSPIGGAKVQVGPSGNLWQADVVLDEEGRATEELWQRGVLFGMVVGPGLTYMVSTNADSDHVTWKIAVPDRRVVGRVVDAATGAPVRDAILGLEFHGSEMSGARSTRSDEDGRFVFESIDAGTHELNVRHEGYTPVQKMSVPVDEADGTYKAEVRLHSAAEGRTLAVSDERDLPVAEALVILGDEDGLRDVAFTGTDGTCTLPLSAAGSGVVFVIPRSGSFGFLRIMPQREGETTIPMRVRNASAAIDVDAKDGDGKPLADVLLMARVNGMMLPAEVLDSLRRVQGVSFVTDANGHARLTGMPPGVYELWAITGRDQMAAVQAPVPPPPSASLEVQSGRYGVTIEFAAR